MNIDLGRDDLTSGSAWRSTFAELIAVFLFVFVGAGAVVATGQITGGTLSVDRLIAIALAHGITIAVLVAAVARVSGAHINPAVTVATVITGKLTFTKGLLYIGAQLVGAALGAFLLDAVVIGESNLGAHALSAAISGSTTGLIVEIGLTFFLVFVIFATAIDPRGPGHLAPFAIGMTVLVNHFIGVPLTGASMNPARSFGPALASGQWADHWVYWAGPIIGAVVAALLYQFIFNSKEQEE